jgi:hypothetical protein
MGFLVYRKTKPSHLVFGQIDDNDRGKAHSSALQVLSTGSTLSGKINSLIGKHLSKFRIVIMIEENLQQVIAHHEQELQTLSEAAARQISCLAILDALDTFFYSWEELEDPSGLPSDFLRHSLSLVVSEHELGDSQVCERLLTTLSGVTTAECRQLVLDALLAIIPPESDNVIRDQVIHTLRGVIAQDETSLLQVLDCLSVLSRMGQGERNEPFLVSLAALPTLLESQLPILVPKLLQYITNEEEAKEAIDAVRTELRLLEEHGDGGEEPITGVSLVFVTALCDSKTGGLLARAYFQVLDEMINSLDEQFTGEHVDTNSEENSFLVLDLAVLLILGEHPSYSNNVKNKMDFLLEHSMFPIDTVFFMIRIAASPISKLYDPLVQPLLSLCIFLLLSPVRVSLLTTPECLMKNTQDIVLDCYHRIDQGRQAELVRCLLQLTEELAAAATTTTTSAERTSNSDDGNVDASNRRRQLGMSRRGGVDLTSNTVLEILKRLAMRDPNNILPVKHILLRRLAADSSGYLDANATRQICSIVSLCMHPLQEESVNASGLDDLLLLLHKLLFTKFCFDSTKTGGEAAMIVRGLMLAEELVICPAVSQETKKAIYQWVQRIVLPTTRRMIEPEIGSRALRFLLALREQNNEPDMDKEIFETMKSLLANTGLV